MKTNMKGFIAGFPVLALLFSCNTDKVDLYDPATDGMYFQNSKDTSRLAFGILEDPTVESAVFTVPVILMGTIAGHDREFYVETVENPRNSATRYEIIQPSVLKAGQSTANIEIRLWQTANLSDKDTLLIRLKDSPDLRALVRTNSLRCVTLYKGVDRPAWWTDQYSSLRLGRFHEIKMEILRIVLGSMNDPYAPDPNRWNFNKMILNAYCEENNIVYPGTNERVKFDGA